MYNVVIIFKSALSDILLAVALGYLTIHAKIFLYTRFRFLYYIFPLFFLVFTVLTWKRRLQPVIRFFFSHTRLKKTGGCKVLYILSISVYKNVKKKKTDRERKCYMRHKPVAPNSELHLLQSRLTLGVTRPVIISVDQLIRFHLTCV